METTTTATSLSVAIATFVICFTGLAIYTAFGAPNKNLSDQFEDHED